MSARDEGAPVALDKRLKHEQLHERLEEEVWLPGMIVEGQDRTGQLGSGSGLRGWHLRAFLVLERLFRPAPQG